MKILYVCILALFLYGCVSDPVYVYEFDPNEKVILARVVDKQSYTETENPKDSELRRERERKEAIVDQTQSMGMAPGDTAIIWILLNTLGLEPPGGYQYQGDPIAYYVDAEDNNHYMVVSYFPNFDIGSCVKLFISKDEVKYPPRIAHGSGCEKSI